MTDSEFHEAELEIDLALSKYEDALHDLIEITRDCATAMGCTRPATPDESRPVELPRITPPRLPTGVDGEGVPPVYPVREPSYLWRTGYDSPEQHREDILRDIEGPDRDV